ncbi:MAG: 16S rRNA (uracil(1498)-N(3))-methyltransferase [Paludibacteraceae bacterium]|nr:16S rRNA (uracil(1498)-N(3))-methyltransferase [Paludibacteraceae bacterium]
MDIFYSPDILDKNALSEEESQHCVKVLRHQPGDEIQVIDGRGTLFDCRIISPHPKHVEVEITDRHEHFGCHPYHLTMAVAPTKNIDRYEWFVEKAVEVGVDRIVPLLGRYSERKIVKRDRLEKIVIAAAKQSMKAQLPIIDEITPVERFIESVDGKLFIAHCQRGEKAYLYDAVQPRQDTTIMIGPEGDFSEEEVSFAISHGATPVSLGDSRLRTETAAVVATTMVSIKNNGEKA